MALTTAQAFTAFQEKISPTDAQRTDITSKREATEKYLRAAFPPSSNLPLKRVILIGSAARGTIVRPVNDLDLMAAADHRNSPPSITETPHPLSVVAGLLKGPPFVWRAPRSWWCPNQPA